MSDIILVTITVAPVNDPPLAVADAYTVAVGTSLTVLAPGVLANDVDDSGAGLTAVLATAVASGTLTLDPNGSFTYVTALTVAGVDSFTYHASDGTALSAPVTVTITVTATSTGGGAGSFGGFATPRQAVLDIDSLALNGGSVGEQPKHGKIITRSGVQYYVPEAGYRGADTFVVGGRRYNVDVLSAMQGDY